MSNNQNANAISKWSEINSDNQAQPSEQLISAVIQLFFDWKDLFASKMKADDWGKHRIDIWALALSDLQITEKEFMNARRKSLTLSWPPTAPADFLELGRGKVSDNYPDMYKSYIDAAHHRWDEDGILYETAKRVGLSAMRELPEVKTYPQWQKHYPEVCIEHSQGKSFTGPSSQQIENKRTPAALTGPTGDMHLDEIRAILAGDQK